MAMPKETWVDISSELWREYIYPDELVLRVNEPILLNISPSSLGGHAHRIQTALGHGMYIAPGWIAICWEPKPDEPIFTF